MTQHDLSKPGSVRARSSHSGFASASWFTAITGIALMGCRAESGPVGPGPAGSDPSSVQAEAGPPGFDGAITIVRPIMPPDPAGWRFDPEGAFVAAETQEGCGIWSIDDGHYGGVLSVDDEADPCQLWPAIQSYDEWEQRGVWVGSHHARFTDEQLVVEGEQGVILEAPCEGCRWASVALNPGAEAVAGAWIGDGDYGIRAWALVDEVWQVAEISLQGFVDEPHEVLDLDLVWGDRLIVMAEASPSQCDEEFLGQDYDPQDCAAAPDFMMGTWSYSSLSAQPDFREFYEMDGNFSDGVFLDPKGEFLWMVMGEYEPREGLGWYLESIPLTQRKSALSWYRGPSDEDGMTRLWDTQARWLSGPDQAWSDASLSEEMAEQWLSWRVVETSPNPSVQSADNWGQGAESEPTWAFYGGVYEEESGEGMAIYRSDACFPKEYAEDMMDAFGLDEPCVHHNSLAKGCEIAATSARRGLALLECHSKLSFAQVDDDGTLGSQTTLARGGGIAWAWTNAGLLVHGDQDGLKLWDVQGQRSRALPSVVVDQFSSIQEAALSTELGFSLVELATPGGPQWAVLDLATGEVEAQVAPGWAVRHAAFSPDRGSLALSDGHEIAVFEFSGPEPDQAKARWNATKVSGLAFRQDGAVLFSGEQHPLPERSWDPGSGEALPQETLSAQQLSKLALGQLDPSWRWSARPEGWITRVLDGRSIHAAPEGAVLDNGLMSGDPRAVEFSLRVGTSAWDPVLGANEVFELLERETLVEDFFTGVVLPDRPLEEAELAAIIRAR